MLCKQYSSSTIGHEISGILTKDICRMDVVDGLFSYAENVQVERSFIRQSNDSKSLKNHIHAYNKNICVNSRA